MSHQQSQDVEVILGNSNAKFSGVTSTMLQTLRKQKEMIGLKVMGKHHVDESALVIGFWQTAWLCRKPLASGLPRVFHARRNDEMIQALVLKHVFGAQIKLLFTSTAQRHHSKFTRWLMSKMDAVISTCSYAASYLTFKPAAIIPHGVDTDAYRPAQERSALLKELGLPEGRLISIFGRVRAQKGVHLYVRACIESFKQHSGYTAIVCGAWDDEAFIQELKAEIEQAGLSERILFLGEQPFEKIPKLFQACSLVAALSRNEGFGLTVLEAMSSGAAVLATKAGAWPDIIREGEDGCLIETESQQQTNQVLAQLLADPAKLDEMGQAGRQRVLEHYTIKAESERLVQLYKELQAGKVAKPAS